MRVSIQFRKFISGKFHTYLIFTGVKRITKSYICNGDISEGKFKMVLNPRCKLYAKSNIYSKEFEQMFWGDAMRKTGIFECNAKDIASIDIV